MRDAKRPVPHDITFCSRSPELRSASSTRISASESAATCAHANIYQQVRCRETSEWRLRMPAPAGGRDIPNHAPPWRWKRYMRLRDMRTPSKVMRPLRPESSAISFGEVGDGQNHAVGQPHARRPAPDQGRDDRRGFPAGSCPVRPKYSARPRLAALIRQQVPVRRHRRRARYSSPYRHRPACGRPRHRAPVGRWAWASRRRDPPGWKD